MCSITIFSYNNYSGVISRRLNFFVGRRPTVSALAAASWSVPGAASCGPRSSSPHRARLRRGHRAIPAHAVTPTYKSSTRPSLFELACWPRLVKRRVRHVGMCISKSPVGDKRFKGGCISQSPFDHFLTCFFVNIVNLS